jgi:hypothetical protein
MNLKKEGMHMAWFSANFTEEGRKKAEAYFEDAENKARRILKAEGLESEYDQIIPNIQYAEIEIGQECAKKNNNKLLPEYTKIWGVYRYTEHEGNVLICYADEELVLKAEEDYVGRVEEQLPF